MRSLNVQQQQMVEETAAENEASQAQLPALQGTSEPSASQMADTRRKPPPDAARAPAPRRSSPRTRKHHMPTRTAGSTGCCRHAGALRQTAQCRRLKNIEALIDDGGDIAIGAIYPIKCAAAAADGHNRMAMLVRREDEALQRIAQTAGQSHREVLRRRDAVDEINGY